jgi:diguanylate cyclase (GGDEF)-like protein
LGLRSIFSHLPAPLSLTLSVGARCPSLPLSARQLLKAAMISDGLRPVEVVTCDGAAVQVTLRRGDDHVLRLSPTQLEGGLQSLLAALLERLYDAEHYSGQLQQFALNSALLSSLRLFAIHMLRVRDLLAQHYLLLSGLTSGHALGFNRAALFLPTDPADPNAPLRGVCAIGEIHTPEAFRIWERMELDDRSLEEVLQASPLLARDTPFERLVLRSPLTPTDALGDEVRASLTSSRVEVFDGRAVVNPSLDALRLRGPFALVALRAPDGLLGLLFVDNCHTRAPISDQHIYYMSMFIGQGALIWQNVLLHQQIEHQARHDPLTGALNRRGFEEAFQAALATYQAAEPFNAAPLCVMAFDLDDFKRINDERGHDAGDAALQTLTALLRARCRPQDALARFGGDEFVLLLPAMSPDALGPLAEEIARDTHRVGLRLSVGASAWPHDCDDPTRLLSIADQRLYASKRSLR